MDNLRCSDRSTEGIVTVNNANNGFISENVTSHPDQWPTGTDCPVSELSMQKVKHKHIQQIEPHVYAEARHISQGAKYPSLLNNQLSLPDHFGQSVIYPDRY